jgi:xylulokinase
MTQGGSKGLAKTVPVLCGVDIGTTYIKAVLVTEEGAIASTWSEPTPTTDDGYGPCHDPDEILATVERAVYQAQQGFARRSVVVGVGVTSVGEEGVPLGPKGEVLYPAVAWYERRPSTEERGWSARHPDDELFRVTGLHKDLGFTLFKWLWLKSHRPEVWRRCTTWVGIGDYVVLRWTGEAAMSVSHASRTGLLDLGAFAWQEEWAAEVLARGARALPPLHDAGAVVGRLLPGRAPGLLTARGVPVVSTGLDHVVGAHAAGAVRPGRVMDSLGTAEALLAEVPPSFVVGTGPSAGVDFGAGLAPGTHIAVAGLGSGAGLDQVSRVLGAGPGRRRAALEASAGRLGPGAGGLVYVPPRARSDVGGALFGLELAHGREHLFRAAVEGWAFAADDALAALGDEAPTAEIFCTGGGANSRLVVQVKAAMLGRAIRRVKTPQVVAVGAALLASEAGLGRNLLKDWEPECGTVQPNGSWAGAYARLRPRFAELARDVHSSRKGHTYP